MNIKTTVRVPAPPTLDEVRRWPATVPVPQGGSAFGYSRSYSYELAARDDFPARLIKRGRTTRVVTASIVAALTEPGAGDTA